MTDKLVLSSTTKGRRKKDNKKDTLGFTFIKYDDHKMCVCVCV